MQLLCDGDALSSVEVFRTKSGVVRCRLLGVHHRAAIVVHLLGFSRDDLYARFGCDMRPDDLAAYYGRLDFNSVRVHGCFDGPELIGVVEIHKTPVAGTAEIALTVDEPWRGVGVGAGLVSLAIADAQQHRYGRRVAYCQEENLAMRRLMASVGFVESVRGDIVVGTHDQPVGPFRARTLALN